MKLMVQKKVSTRIYIIQNTKHFWALFLFTHRNIKLKIYDVVKYIFSFKSIMMNCRIIFELPIVNMKI